MGYQAEGTLGRLLLEGAEKVKLFGEDISVRASILQLPGVSGHADNEGLMRWISSVHPAPKKVFVTHGDDQVCMIFRDRLQKELGLDAYAPYSGTVYDLAEGRFLYEGVPIPVVQEEPSASDAREKSSAHADAQNREPKIAGRKEDLAGAEDQNRVTRAYQQLLEAGNRMMQVIRHNKGGANKDLERFAEELNRLSDHWDR